MIATEYSKVNKITILFNNYIKQRKYKHINKQPYSQLYFFILFP